MELMCACHLSPNRQGPKAHVSFAVTQPLEQEGERASPAAPRVIGRRVLAL